jgi:hypothetical protein
MSEHAWVQENIASYVAGGLEPAERERLEQHISGCGSCAAALEEARGLDQTLQSLFTPVRPTPGLEDRMIRSLRIAPRRYRIGRVIAAAAAVVLVGAIGAGATTLIVRGGVPFPGQWAVTFGGGKAEQALRAVKTENGRNVMAIDSPQKIEPGSRATAGVAPPDASLLPRLGPSFTDGTSNTILFSERLGDVKWVDANPNAKNFSGEVNNRFNFSAGGEERNPDAGALGYYPPARALGVKDKSSVHTALGGGLKSRGEPADKAPKQANLGAPKDEEKLDRAAAKVDYFKPGDLESQAEANAQPQKKAPASVGQKFVVGNEVVRQDAVFRQAPQKPAPAETPAPNEAIDPLGPLQSRDLAGKVANKQFDGRPAKDEKSKEASAKADYFKPGDLEAQLPANSHAQKKAPEPQKPATTAGQDVQPNRALDPVDRQQRLARSDPPPSPAPRKIVIRSGDIEFEVQSFDSAVAAVTRLVNDIKGGFVATVNSEKLPNGKVRGSVAVRVPPEHLDSFVLDLRKELGKQGELKGLRIGSQDITKQYTDLESRLRAARAMEERLLQIIKSGQGQIKDLLAAEKELGVWRTRIEEFEGELRYYQNLVSLSTLTITLYEKEIRSPYAILQTERVQMGLEVEDVEKAHRAALAAVAEAKGRVTKSEMRQHAAGQFSAVLNFEVAPDAGGPLRDRLKQLGTVARLDVDRLQQEEGGTGRPGDAKIKERDTVFLVSFYNLANVAPRETVHLNLAAADAETAYKTILARVEKSFGRVVSSSLNHQRNDQTRGEIQFEIKSADAEAVLLDLKNVGEVMRLQVTENADTQNVTKSKRGFNVQIWALAAVAPRETSTIQLATKDVPAGYRKLQESVIKSKGRVLNSQLNEQDKQNVTAQLDFEVPRADEAAVAAAMTGIGDVYSRNVVRAQDGDSVVDSKVRLQVSLINVARIPPRETTVLGIEVADVDQTVDAFSALIAQKQGRAVESHVARERTGRVTAKLVYDVPLSAAPDLIDKFKGAGTLRVHQSSRNPQVPDSNLATARLDVTLSNVELIVPSDDGLWPQVRRGLSWSFTALAWSLSWIIVGLCVVLPWALVLYGLYRLALRLRRRPDVVSS